MIVAPLTPKTNASRVLTDLGLRRGQGRDFMITGGEPRITGGQTHIVVVMWNDRASRIVAQNQNVIRQALEGAGTPFLVRGTEVVRGEYVAKMAHCPNRNGAPVEPRCDC